MNKLLNNELLNLLLIHDGAEDDEPSAWIRFHVSHEACGFFKVLTSSMTSQLHKGNSHFLEELISCLPHEVTVESAKEWFKPRSHMPVAAVLSLLRIEQEILGKNEDEIANVAAQIIPRMEYFYSSRNSEVSTKLPCRLSDDLLYLVGVIAGDGSLPRKRKRTRWEYPIVIEKANEVYVRDIYVPLFEKIFDIKLRLRANTKVGRQPTWRAEIGSKPIYRYLTRLFDHPAGKKAGRLRISQIIRTSSPMRQLPYFAGLVDTDFGSLGAGMGITTASPRLVDDLSDLLSNIGVQTRRYEYLKDKKFKMYQLVVPNKNVDLLVQATTKTYAFKNPKRIKFMWAGVAKPG